MTTGDRVQDYKLGQRWISDTESQMGLGTVMSIDARSVTIVFLATGETRIYSIQTAPLRRVSFGIGDIVQSHEGWSLRIESVREENGLFRYLGQSDEGKQQELAEEDLDNFLQLNRSSDRFFNGKIDADEWFNLRYLSWFHLNRLAHHPLRGIIGGRTSLIPHQLYIAHEIANRYAPRVLLADEVGLGKTIEAGMILHQQLLTERASRILIVVPETLVHQWFVEMLRRFNLHFHIFDEERCLANVGSADAEDDTTQNLGENPFHSEQLVLCSTDFLKQHQHRLSQLIEGEWDILVVDEAHHLQWSEDDPSTEYQMVEKLAAVTKGVLLLTATPEQLGKASHFARLRLLDPDRFPSFDIFVEEEANYEPIAEIIEDLLNGKDLTKKNRQVLLSNLSSDDNQYIKLIEAASESKIQQQGRQQLIDHLLDRHGTGRVLFRNTRNTIKGFPQRKFCPYELALPDEYQQLFQNSQDLALTEMQFLLSPELLFQLEGVDDSWIKFDPRVSWLMDKLQELKSEKVLLITAFARTALQLAAYYKKKTGRTVAVFHEGLNIIERDKAAAYFADHESGSPVLLCSEIGSEGRNFQFSHHLILFDLPFNPDLLEQRIGRLDRIGQESEIQIHLPVIENSPVSIMAQWYHQGLKAFEETCPSAHTIFVKLRAILSEALHQIDDGLKDLPNLIETSKVLREKLNAEMSRGREKLLEYNSCRPQIARDLLELAEQQDRTISPMEFMENVYECFGIDYEDMGNQKFLIRPSAHMQMQSFPGLPEEGMMISYNRDTALANDDVHFISWDHPIVTGAMELVFSQEQGNTGMVAIRYPGAKAGSLMMESIFVLEPAPHPVLQSGRYLPTSVIRVVSDQQGRDHHKDLAAENVRSEQLLEHNTILKIIKSQNHTIRNLIKQCESLASQQAPQIISQAHQQANNALHAEIDRLRSLQEHNPNVRQEEIDFFINQKNALNEAIKSVNLRLDALRVLIILP